MVQGDGCRSGGFERDQLGNMLLGGWEGRAYVEAVAELEGRVEEVLVPLVAEVEHPVAVHL